MIDAAFVTPFDDDTELSSDAVDTGYRRDGREIWASADRTVVYVVGDGRVEVWPRHRLSNRVRLTNAPTDWSIPKSRCVRAGRDWIQTGVPPDRPYPVTSQ